MSDNNSPLDITDDGTIKSRGVDFSRHEVSKAVEGSWGDLVDELKKQTGEDYPVVHDPFGFTGDARSHLQKMFDEHYSDIYAEAAELREEGLTTEEAILNATTESTEKNYIRTDASLPVHVVPDIFRADEELTPFRDMLPIRAVGTDTIKVDELVDLDRDELSFDEPDNSDPVTKVADHDYLQHEYDVQAYGIRGLVSDFNQLAQGTLRNALGHKEQTLLTSLRQYEARQILRGQDGYDPNGFAGLPDVADADNVTDEMGEEAGSIEHVRDNLTDLIASGAAPSDVIHVTDPHTFRELKTDADEFIRYDSPAPELDFGFESLRVDGSQVVQSHAAIDEPGERAIWSVDMTGQSMGVLQGETIKPLGKSNASERVLVDKYATFVSSGTTRIYGVENLA